MPMTVATSDGFSLWAFRYSSEAHSPRFDSATATVRRRRRPEIIDLQDISDGTQVVMSEPLGAPPGARVEVSESPWRMVRRARTLWSGSRHPSLTEGRQGMRPRGCTSVAHRRFGACEFAADGRSASRPKTRPDNVRLQAPSRSDPTTCVSRRCADPSWMATTWQHTPGACRQGPTRCRPRRISEPGADRRCMTPRLYRISEVAELLSCGRTTVYALIKAGELKSVKVAGLRRVHADDLADYLDRLRQQDQEPPRS